MQIHHYDRDSSNKILFATKFCCKKYFIGILSASPRYFKLIKISSWLRCAIFCTESAQEPPIIVSKQNDFVCGLPKFSNKKMFDSESITVVKDKLTLIFWELQKKLCMILVLLPFFSTQQFVVLQKPKNVNLSTLRVFKRVILNLEFYMRTHCRPI